MTCPLAETRLPWVGRAARAYRDREKACLPVWGEPTAVLMDAVYAIESGVQACEAHEAEKRRRELDEQRAAARTPRSNHDE